MKLAIRFAALGTLLGSGLLAGCSESVPAADGQSGINWNAIKYPIFDKIEAQCAVRACAVATERRAGTVTKTELPPEIQWAQSFPEAIERATREGKPIFIASSVRKGGNPDCPEV